MEPSIQSRSEESMERLRVRRSKAKTLDSSMPLDRYQCSPMFETAMDASMTVATDVCSSLFPELSSLSRSYYHTRCWKLS